MLVPRTALAAALVIVLTRSGGAQTDYRNLDDERPLATEDAYPVERYAFDALVAYHFDREHDGARTHLAPLELTYGIVDNTHVGITAPVAALDPALGRTNWGLAGLGAFALYNFNTESPNWPALSIRVDASAPVGSLAGDVARASLKAIATRSWGRSRFHLNVARGVGPENGLGSVEVIPRWRYSLAADRTLYRPSLLLVTELVATRATRGAPVELNAAVGMRYQWSPTVVLDVGVARRLRADLGPEYALTVGWSHVFGLDWLVPPGSR